MPEPRAPVLRWQDGPNDRRLLFAGNGTAPVAEVEPGGSPDPYGAPWLFTVYLPGAPFEPMRPFESRGAIEAYATGIVTAWFKEIYA